jgi:hypothetical protein
MEDSRGRPNDLPIVGKNLRNARRHKPEAHNNSYMKNLWVSLAWKERNLSFNVMLITRPLLKGMNGPINKYIKERKKE